MRTLRRPYKDLKKADYDEVVGFEGALKVLLSCFSADFKIILVQKLHSKRLLKCSKRFE